MADRKREQFSPPTTGGAALLTVFAVLCLTVFSLLSLSTVRADKKLSDASANAVKTYYAADCKAQEVLSLLRQGETPDDIDVTVYDGFAANSYDAIYEYAVPISDTQELRVTVRTLGDRYSVEQWQAVPIGDWVANEDLEVWDGWF